MPDTIRLAGLLCEEGERRKRIAELASYNENNFDGSYGPTSLTDKVEAKGVSVASSGAMEKNTDISHWW